MSYFYREDERDRAAREREAQRRRNWTALTVGLLLAFALYVIELARGAFA